MMEYILILQTLDNILILSVFMISDILKTSGVYSNEDGQLFEDRIKFRSVRKDEILLKQGEVCKSVFFNIQGAFYQYNYTIEMEENVIELHSDNEWFLNHGSFIAQKPSADFIKAYTESTILEISIESIHWLIGKSPAFLQVGRIFEQATSRVHFFDKSLTPAQKYHYILNNRQGLIQKFPLKFIASYLKITPETLSRTRKKFSRVKIVLDFNQVVNFLNAVSLCSF